MNVAAMNRAAAAAAATFCLAFQALAQAPVPTFTKAHDAMVQAIKTGTASGRLVGQVDEQFTRQFRSTGPLMVDVTVLQDLPRKDCKRLRVVYTKKDVDTPKGKTDAILNTQMNYCLDGSPPIALPQSNTGG